MTTSKGKIAIGIATADRLNAEIKHREAKIFECDVLIIQMRDEIATLEKARDVTVGTA